MHLSAYLGTVVDYACSFGSYCFSNLHCGAFNYVMLVIVWSRWLRPVYFMRGILIHYIEAIHKPKHRRSTFMPVRLIQQRQRFNDNPDIVNYGRYRRR